ncbi:MAG TPA: hypothetical protein VFZ29_11850 [Solirubrobacterales bacterium]
MKRKFPILAVLAALVALAVPASSTASIYPAGHQFEIAGGATPPKLGTSLGTCAITKIAGTIPSAPANEGAVSFPISVPTVGSCTSGTSIALSGAWTFVAPAPGNPYGVNIGGTATLRYSSLPGCKLSGATLLAGIWSNGTTSPKTLKSGFHGHDGHTLTWSDDGASCALSGKTEKVSVSQETGAGLGLASSSVVTDLTVPAMPVLVTP